MNIKNIDLYEGLSSQDTTPTAEQDKPREKPTNLNHPPLSPPWYNQKEDAAWKDGWVSGFRAALKPADR